MTRSIEIVKRHYALREDKDYKMPSRATSHSAGYDFYNLTGEDILIPAGEWSKAITTFHKASMAQDEVLKIYPRSSFGFKHQTVLVNSVGIIDSDYYNNEQNEGEIYVKFWNYGDKEMVIPAGTAFCQGIFQKYLITDSDSFDGQLRCGGIGSTT